MDDEVIIDLDPFLEAALAIENRTTAGIQTPDPVAALPYSSRGPLDVDTDIKNFLVEKAGVGKNLIDLMVGRRGGFRDRAFGPQYDEQGLPRPQRGLLKELFDPTDAATIAAKEAGVSTKNSQTELAEYASYLPEDVYETGVQKLIRQHYNQKFDIPLDFDYEFQREPYNKQIIYKDPTSGEFTYLNPPGIDMGNLKAVGAQLGPEIIGAVSGAFTTMNPAKAVTSPIVGAAAGYTVAGGAADLMGLEGIPKEIVQVAGGIGGGFLSAGTGRVTPIILGETVGGFIARHQTLQDLDEKGLLDETYDKEKIYKVALKDAGVTFAFAIGSNAIASGIMKSFGKGGYDIKGFDYDAFERAFNSLKAEASGDKAAQKVITTSTVPEIMEAGNVGSIITREGYQGELLDAASQGGKQAQLVKARLDEGKRAKQEGLDTQLESITPSMPTKTGTVQENLKELQGSDIVRRREQMGKEMKREFDSAIDPKVLEIEKQIETTRGDFGDQLNLLTDPEIEPEYALNYIRETLEELRKAAGKSKGDKTIDPYGSFKVKLNKMVETSKNQDKVLDNILDLSNTGNRPFFQELLNDPQFPEARAYLKNSFLNKYKNNMARDEAGNLIPLTSKQHDEFISSNKNSIEDLLNPEEIATLNSSRLWGQKLARQEAGYKKIINELRKEPWGARADKDPEFIFRETWTKQKEGITRTKKVKDIIGENQELADEYRLQILKDMKQQTGNFDGAKLVKYADEYGAMLDEWYPKDFSKNLRAYGKLIDKLEVGRGMKDLPPFAIEIMKKLARVYIGFFTAAGRALSAGQQALGIYSNRKLVEVLMDPQKLLEEKAARNFLQSPIAKAFLRAGGREYGRSTETVSGYTDPESGQLPIGDPFELQQQTKDYNSVFNMDEIKLNRGGNPLIELKYNY
jgi:hypothetical protein